MIEGRIVAWDEPHIALVAKGNTKRASSRKCSGIGRYGCKGQARVIAHVDRPDAVTVRVAVELGWIHAIGSD